MERTLRRQLIFSGTGMISVFLPWIHYMDRPTKKIEFLTGISFPNFIGLICLVLFLFTLFITYFKSEDGVLKKKFLPITLSAILINLCISIIALWQVEHKLFLHDYKEIVIDILRIDGSVSIGLYGTLLSCALFIFFSFIDIDFDK